MYLDGSLDAPIVDKYYLYHKPENCEDKSEEYFVEKLGNAIDNSIDRLVDISDDSQIVVPISGGLDSRLVLSKLVEHGCKNLKSFSYGPRGNSDASIGKEVSDKLGVPWEFVLVEASEAKKYYESDIRKDYSEFADGLNVVPNYQDLIPISKLIKSGSLDSNSIVVNGQSGDFNTGGHIPDVLYSEKAMLEGFYDALIQKHFSLWNDLLTDSNLKKIRQDIGSQLNFSDKNSLQYYIENMKLADLYERWEFEERQTKYIVNGQRIYDYFSLNWHLPLWDGEFVRFWCGVPIKFRYKQHLYRKYLNNWNYKGLFNDFNPVIRAWSNRASSMIIPISLILRVLLGREKRDNIIKYFDYISRYGNHYHSFGFNLFYKNIHKIRNPISLYTMSWLCERGLAEYVKEYNLNPLFEQ